MDHLIKKLSTLKKSGFTGTVTCSFHQGSLSKMIKVETIEETGLDKKTDKKLSVLKILK
jgi:hypothetical protein